MLHGHKAWNQDSQSGHTAISMRSRLHHIAFYWFKMLILQCVVQKKRPIMGKNKDCRVGVNAVLSELELTHGMCIEFIWLGTGVIFSVKNQEVKNGVVICAWQKLRAFPWGPLPPCWPQGSLLLQHPLTLRDHTSTPAAGMAHPAAAAAAATPQQIHCPRCVIKDSFVRLHLHVLVRWIQKLNTEEKHRGRYIKC